MEFNQLYKLQKLIQTSLQQQKSSTELESVILTKPPLSNTERISIYQKAYLIRMTESLNEDFEILKSQIPENEFEKLIQDYIFNDPSDVRNLAEYSLKFPQFVFKKNPEHYEHAIKDWLILCSNQALDDESNVSIEQVQSGQSFDLVRHPACITKSVQNNFFIVYRFQNEALLETLSENEFCILNFLETQQSLKDLEQFIISINVNAQLLQSYISEWIAKKIILLKRSSS